MKAYVATTGTIFSLIFVMHIWRAVVEGPGLAKNPIFILLTIAAGGLALWAWRLFRSVRS